MYYTDNVLAHGLSAEQWHVGPARAGRTCHKTCNSCSVHAWAVLIRYLYGIFRYFNWSLAGWLFGSLFTAKLIKSEMILKIRQFCLANRLQSVQYTYVHVWNHTCSDIVRDNEGPNWADGNRITCDNAPQPRLPAAQRSRAGSTATNTCGTPHRLTHLWPPCDYIIPLVRYYRNYKYQLLIHLLLFKKKENIDPPLK